MSFAAPKRVIEEKDTVILYLTATSRHAIDVTREITNKNGESIEYVFQTSFGALKVASLIGTEYGSKVSLLLIVSVGHLVNTSNPLTDRAEQRMGVCAATDARTMDTHTAPPHANHLHTRHQHDSAAA